MRYNTSLSHEALMQNMNQIQMLLNVSANSMKSAAAQEGMDIPQYEEWLRENPDKIAALEQQVAELAQQPASERLLQARTELDRYKSELQEAEEKLENLKQKVARHRNWAERLIEIAGQMRAHMTEPGYNRETAIADIDTFIQGFEPYLTEGLETEEAKEFMRAVLQLGGLDHEIDAVSEANRVEDLEDSEIVFAPLSEQDAQSLKQAKKTAADRLNAAAQKLYAKTNPKPYKTVLTETLLDAAKAQQMGNALQDWFADTRTDGDKLHTAYMALLAAHRNNRELTADSAEVIAARDALIQCIKLRAARLDSIMKNKNTSDKSIEIDAVLMKLLKGHWFSTLCRLDVCGMVYFKEYKLHQSDKDRIKRQAKERHSQYVERYLNDIRACALKDKLQELDDALLLYQNAPNQEKKRQAKQTINTTITAILRSLTHTISFRSPGKKLLASLLAEYEREPSTDALCKLFREANKYIRTQFQNTSFMDAGVNRQGRKVPSAYSSAYDDAFVTKELLVHLKDMEFGLNQTDQLDENRKPVKLIDRLNTDHNLQWLQ